MSAVPLYPAAGRLDELSPAVQDAIRQFINALASAGSLISSDEQSTIMSRLNNEVSELTRERMPDEPEEEESDDEDDGWEDTYSFGRVSDEMCGDHPHLQQFKETHDGVGAHYTHSVTYYHQTYGGGPEGGYFVKHVYTPIGSPNDDQTFVYEVRATLFDPFTAVLLPGKTLEVRNYNSATGLAQVRIEDDL